jgi:hypothetical protein
MNAILNDSDALRSSFLWPARINAANFGGLTVVAVADV